MDAEDALVQRFTAIPNSLPYFITEAGASRIVPVRFEKLMATDAMELNSLHWSASVFRDVWRQSFADDRMLKLVREDNAAIQGLVHLGQAETNGFLRKSLLETAPFNRYGAEGRQHTGVGRVLIARLVVESLIHGMRGRVAVRARRGSEKFYASLGFEQSPYLPQAFALHEVEAAALLQSVLRDVPGGTA